ncbi:hypothetical protein BV22DRAFT_1103957 [Leucogyrophana mollusca]|uniref:Uncharacterized protein n=1 Tax=Leucogyrophana mollusca TaxID=85980 RepID=A0ACB8BMA6_9AGAM|nr:hypothetical protein BV22DRAFT_1103957 [Leucogyrophana mollusca]
MSRNELNERPQKRAKVDQNAHKGFTFMNAYDVRQALRNQDQTTSTDALIALRNQLTLRHGEIVSPQDGRLSLIKQWMDMSPGAHDIFETWEHMSQTSTLALPISLLSNMLTLLSSHFPYHSYGIPIIKTLLLPQWMRRLNSYIGGSHNELILVTLKLFNAMSAFGGGRERKSVMDTFHWESKTLPKVLHMRRKGKGEEQSNALARPDIRTLYLLFILSFIDEESPAAVKSTFLERHRDAFLGIFKGLVQDSYPVVRRVLEVCWAGLWSDPKIKRTTKINLFSEATITHLAKLYDRTVPESADGQYVPADLVHHFLLAICTRPGQGICFKDKGWYPRETDLDASSQDDDSRTWQRGGKIHNKILSNILKPLKVNEDARQQELALKIMSACPELVASYWSAAALTLEPRLSSKWIANIAFFGLVLSQPVPSASFLLPGSDLYHPYPPPLSTILENVLPSVNTKSHFSKGLQSVSPLVQHCTALALAKCLIKFSDVTRSFRVVEAALEEDEEDGQWCKRRRELEKEVRRRVPDFQVIVAFSQQKPPPQAGDIAQSSQNCVKAALLSESAQRLLWLYHRCLPSLAAEARFDVGKLLQNLRDTSSPALAEVDVEKEPSTDGGSAFRIIKQLHLLRLLQESDQFTWSGKMTSSPHTYLHVLLKTFSTTQIRAVRTTLRSLLCRILSESIVFQEDTEEANLWLASLSSTRRGPGSESPDGAPLTDEAEGVATFLDDCVQRCLKTPYRYFESMQDLLLQVTASSQIDSEDSIPEHTDPLPSPLLMTVLEQLDAKLTMKLMSPSDILAIFTFIRKLIFKLSSKQQDLRLLLAISDKLASIAPVDGFSTVTASVQRELSILRVSLGVPQEYQELSISEPVQEFLRQIEKIQKPTNPIVNAYELVDWLRLAGHTLHPTELRRLSSIIERFHKPALRELFESLHPAQGLLWIGMDLRSSFVDFREELDFDLVFAQSREADLSDPRCRDILVEALFSHHPSRALVEQAIYHITHRLTSSNGPSHKKDVLLLLSTVMQRSAVTLEPAETAHLKEFVFSRCQILKSLCVSPNLSDMVQEVEGPVDHPFLGLSELLDASLDCASEADRKLVSPLSAFWVGVFRSYAISGIQQSLPQIKVWIRYLDPEELLLTLDFISARDKAEITPLILGVLETYTLVDLPLRSRTAQLLALRSLLPDSTLLEDMIATAVSSFLPPCHDGCPLPLDSSSTANLASLTASLSSQRRSPLSALSPGDVVQLLYQKSWAASTAQIVSALLYSNALPSQEYARWLNSVTCTNIMIEYLAPTLHAFLDSSDIEDLEAIGDTVMFGLFDRLLPRARRSDDVRRLCHGIIISLITRDVRRRTAFVASIQRNLDSSAAEYHAADYMAFAARLRVVDGLGNLVTNLIDRGLQWTVRNLPTQDEAAGEVLRKLTLLVKHESKLKTHFVEPVLTAAIQHCLSDPTVLQLSASLLQHTTLKPAVVNRYLQSILQHPQFFKACEAQKNGSLPRDAVIYLLQVLFHLHPTNTCQASHVGPLARVYGGTMSVADRRLLSIFKLFETERKISVSSILSTWSPSSDIIVTKPIEAVQNLEPIRILRTCLVFPIWRRFMDEDDDCHAVIDDQVYDPLFVVSLVAQMLSETPPTSALAWVEVFRTNAISLLIRCLSAKDPNLREASLCQIAALWHYLQASDMQEKPQVLYIFNVLKNALPPPSDDAPTRLPSFASLILLHSLRGIFYPSNFIYPPTARFLLQRPELDVTDVPMLYGMLYSNSDDWKKERGWIIRFLSDGMMSTEDWKVFKRRNTWDLLASLFQSSERDQALRNGILEVLANLTCNAQATMSLILKSSLLSWMEMQLQTCRRCESIAWLKIIENVLTLADVFKFERSTNGEWRAALSRCLSLVLESGAGSTISTLRLVVSATLRLSLLNEPRNHLHSLLADILGCMERLEGSIVYRPKYRGGGPVEASRRLVIPPHHAHGLHDTTPVTDPLAAWGEMVEELWRASMTLYERHSQWDALTNRLLVWRGVAGAERSPVGEWVRREVLRNLRSSAGGPSSS